MKPDTYYALLWRSRTKRDGLSEHIIHKDCVPMLFSTRSQARTCREKYYGYLRSSPDLRREPHGWLMPKVVKVRVEVVR